MPIPHAEMNALHKALIDLHRKWETFDKLFVESKHHETLNKASPGSWQQIKYALWHSVLLGIQRLLDPSKTLGNKNLSLQTLIDSANGSVPATTLHSLKEIQALARKKSQGFKTNRNTWIAHHDYELATATDRKAYRGSAADIRTVLDLLDGFMHTLVGNPTECWPYNSDAAQACDVDRLIGAIEAGLNQAVSTTPKSNHPASSLRDQDLMKKYATTKPGP